MGHRSDLWFLHAKQRIKEQNYKSLWAQPSSVVLCIHNSDIMTRINSLYGSHTSPVVLCRQNNVIITRITSLHGCQTSPVVFVHAKQGDYHQKHKSLLVTALICGFCRQNSAFWIRNTSLYGSHTSPVEL